MSTIRVDLPDGVDVEMATTAVEKALDKALDKPERLVQVFGDDGALVVRKRANAPEPEVVEPDEPAILPV